MSGRQRVKRRELDEVEHPAAHDERDLEQQVHEAHALEAVAGEPVEQSRAPQYERDRYGLYAEAVGVFAPVASRTEGRTARPTTLKYIIVTVVIRNVEQVGLACLLFCSSSRALLS